MNHSTAFLNLPVGTGVDPSLHLTVYGEADGMERNS